MSLHSKTRQGLIAENEELRTRLAETADILRAIRSGEVDALLITGTKGARIATLDGADSAFRVLVEAMSEGAAILDYTGMLLYCNSSFAALLKAPLQSVMGAALYRFTSPTNHEILKELLEQAQTHAIAGEIIFSCEDGTAIPMQLSFDPMQIHGQPSICVIASDLTERKRAEEALLRENEEKYRRLFEAESDAIFLVDSSSGKILDANIAASNLFGYSHDEMIGMYNTGFSASTEESVQVEIDHSASFPISWNKKKDSTVFPVEMTTAHLTLKGRAMHIIAIRDISERRRSEAVIAALALRNQTLLNTATDGIHVLDELGNVVDANPAFCAMLGYSREEMQHLNVVNWDMQWSSEDLMAKINRLITAPALFETRHRRKDGTIRDVEINSVGITLDGRSYLYASARDITERKQAEADLRASEQQYHDMFETNTAIKLLIDPSNGAIVRANQAAADFYGWATRVLETMNITQINTLSVEQIRSEMSIAVRSGRTYFDFSHRLASGEIRDVEIHSSPMENGGRKLLFSIVHDISDRKKAETTLRVSEERYRMLVEQAAEAILVYDVDLAKIVDANGIAEKIFGYKRETLCSHDVSTFYAVDQPDGKPVSTSMDEHITRALRGEVVIFERTLVNAEQANILCEERLVKLPSVDHRLLRASYVDITERKEVEAKIRNLNEMLEERVKIRTAQLELVNQELTSLSYSMAHSLKTPLRALDGFSYFLMEEYNQALDENGKDYLKRIRSASRHIWRVTDDLIELMSITRGELKLCQVDLSQMAREIIRSVKITHPEHQVEFICPDGLCVEADLQMTQVLMENLLGNAWKFTRDRKPALIEFGSLVQKGQTVFFIRDNGVGIDMAYAHKLFGVFQRLHGQEEFEGTGVGLAMTQRIVQRHGGRIWADGVVNQYATFYFTFR